MQIFKTKWFQRWAGREALTDNALLAAVEEIGQGLVDADLGGHVVKKRIGTRGRGKSSSVRTLLASELLGYTNAALEKAMKAGELIEVNING